MADSQGRSEVWGVDYCTTSLSFFKSPMCEGRKTTSWVASLFTPMSLWEVGLKAKPFTGLKGDRCQEEEEEMKSADGSSWKTSQRGRQGVQEMGERDRMCQKQLSVSDYNMEDLKFTKHSGKTKTKLNTHIKGVSYIMVDNIFLVFSAQAVNKISS